MSIKIITTADGSHSLLNQELNETYHSVHGALQESVHVFIRNGLEHVIGNPSPICIFEVGFGTGLNALLTLQSAERYQKKVHYMAIESSPVPEKIWSCLNYSTSLGLETEYKALHVSMWEVTQPISNHFSLLKYHKSLQEIELSPHSVDLIYYDAFAPSKQPELWELPILEKVSHWLKPGGILVTYCAKGQVKRDLTRLGLTVETLPGPPGKKEMVRARKS